MSDEAHLQAYFKDLQAEVSGTASQFGLNPDFAQRECVFADIATRLMAEMGLIPAPPEICRYEERFGEDLLRLTAGAVSDDRERLDVFVSLYEAGEVLPQVSTERIVRAAGAALLFLKHCADGSLAPHLAQDAPVAPLVNAIGFSWKTLDQIRIWVLANGLATDTRFKPREIGGKLVGLEVVDLRRLSRMALEGEKSESVAVDFVQKCGEPLPCVFYSSETAPYDTALCLFPGEVLRSLYESFDARLLEANVRSYLSMQSKVNRGIFTTLKDRPEDFLAFNNGVVIVADGLQIARTSTGTTGVKAIRGMRIVNGGQTTATLFFGQRHDRELDLSRVRIPAKILVLKEPDSEKSEGFLTDISRFANTQNTVRASDLSSSSPFHVGLEHLARTTWCPDGVTQWFYERATGAYRTMIAKEKTPAGRRRLKAAVPAANRITKLDLARYMNAWLGHPDVACLSPQKSFALFMKGLEDQADLSSLKLSPGTWKDIVSVAILYRAAYKAAREAFPGNAAPIAAYSVAITANRLGRAMRLRAIWEAQGVSGALLSQIALWQKEINGILRLSSLGKPISDWAKEAECWKFVLESVEGAADPAIPEIQAVPATAARGR